MKKQVIILFIVLLFSGSSSFCEVRLPKLVSDGMILQRETPLKIWGWASAGEKVKLQFNKLSFETVAAFDGNWQIILPSQKAGGPFDMVITATNRIVLKDVLFGDVWLCSGQSNMELPMKRVAVIYSDEIASSENAFIRQFLVTTRCNYVAPQIDLQDGKWEVANPQNVLHFPAVGYFFARELYAKYKIPIGLISCSAGGACAEGWMSEEALKAFPEQYMVAKQLQDTSYMRNLIFSEQTALRKWFEQLGKNDLGRKETPWFSTQLDDSNWSTLQIPASFSETGMDLINGLAWFRKEIDLPESCSGKPALLELGRIVDSDSVFINGQFVGTTSYQYPPRRYAVGQGILKTGKNIIAVKVVSQSGGGSFIKDKPYQLDVDGHAFDLKGTWKYKVGAKCDPCPSSTFFPGKPLGLYNAMLHPVINYSIKGVVWYQGETNAERPDNYTEVLSTLIKEWRRLWNIKDLPFLCVQLPNFMEERKQPSESNWAVLRDQQLKILSVPKTALVVTLGLGEWNDIHPLRKKEIGERLALAAENRVYRDKNVVYSGPLFKSMKIKGNKAEIEFSNCGSGLVAKGNKELKYFAIAGADKKYVWAKAEIKGKKVVVWNDQIDKPVSVRYAWADNPEGANLYNEDRLPASPFTTEKKK